jgi:hypothetical protein
VRALSLPRRVWGRADADAPAGTGIQLFGSATDASYDVLVDGKAGVPFAASAEQNLLAGVDGLPQAAHTVSLVARPGSAAGTLSFAFATATVSAERVK